jgi:chorismate synthase
MAGNSFGQAFRITTAGESHGLANVLIIDGVPSGIPLTENDFTYQLARRKPGQSKITTQRKEEDKAEILSGIFDGQTTGTSLAILIKNSDQRSSDYSDIADKYRPGHADYTFDAKYGFRDYRGGGRSSARETVVRVAAGVIARKVLHHLGHTIQIVGYHHLGHTIQIVGYVKQIGDIIADIPDTGKVTEAQVESNIVRCPDKHAAEQMITLIEQVRKERDSIGGMAEIVASGVPAGWGEPVFDKLRADLGKGLLSLPAVMGIEFGAGFDVVSARGSENNDLFIKENDKVVTKTNRHGGMLGGISSGMPIVVRCAVKPTSSIPQDQPTIDTTGAAATISTKGRHDPCLLPRFIPMAEAMIAIVLADHGLRQRVYQNK